MNRREFLAAGAVLGLPALFGGEMPKPGEHHFWTGSAWLTGQQQVSSQAGNQRLFVAPTTAGWRVEIGDATYPIRYWDGTNTRFSVDAAGGIAAVSLYLTQASAGVAALTIDSTGASATAHILKLLDTVGVESLYLSREGNIATGGTTIDMFVSLTDAFSTFQIARSGGVPSIGFGPGGASTRDVYLQRSAANTIEFTNVAGTGKFLWGSSYLDTGNGIRLAERTTPGTPAANTVHLYAKDLAGVSRLYYIDDAGVDHGPL